MIRDKNIISQAKKELKILVILDDMTLNIDAIAPPADVGNLIETIMMIDRIIAPRFALKRMGTFESPSG